MLENYKFRFLISFDFDDDIDYNYVEITTVDPTKDWKIADLIREADRECEDFEEEERIYNDGHNIFVLLDHMKEKNIISEYCVLFSFTTAGKVWGTVVPEIKL